MTSTGGPSWSLDKVLVWHSSMSSMSEQLVFFFFFFARWGFSKDKDGGKTLRQGGQVWHWAHSSHYASLRPPTFYIPQKHLAPSAPPPNPFHWWSPRCRSLQWAGVASGFERPSCVNVFSCCATKAASLSFFDPTPRQARPAFFLATAGDQGMRAWLQKCVSL